MAFISDEEWADFRQGINDFHNDVFQQEIIWKKQIVTKDYHGEDSNQRFVNVPLKGLMKYNDFRSWPLTETTDSGEIDKQSIMVYFNIKYLRDNGYTNTEGNFIFDPAMDRFIVNGVKYKAMGDSQSAQAKDQPLLIFIVLKREDIGSGINMYQPPNLDY